MDFIESNIGIMSNNEIFCEIYNNYIRYGFMDKEYCKNYLLLVFGEIYNTDIDLNEINKMIEGNEDITRSCQTNFRKEIINRFKNCIISGVDCDSCQAAHIYDLKYEKLNYDVNNGILLSATLHLEFDQLKWCINPETYNIEISKNHQMRNLEINKYKHLNLKHVLGCYPSIQYYLQKKYNQFINQ